MIYSNKPNWRDEIKDVGKFYIKKYAIFPRIIGGQFVWLKNYHVEYHDYSGHHDFVKNITQEEYTVIKLKGEV
jgi:hypothetical protein